MNTKLSLLATGLCALFLAAALPSQQASLSLSTSADPSRGLAFLTADLGGPPGGAGILLASLPPAAPIPTPWGMFHLDPAALLPLGIVPLDRAGAGHVQFPLGRVPELAGLSFAAVFQALALDATFHPFALTNGPFLVLNRAQHCPACAPCTVSVTATQRAGYVRACVKITCGGTPVRNAKVLVWDRANPMGRQSGTTDANGEWCGNLGRTTQKVDYHIQWRDAADNTHVRTGSVDVR